MKLATNAVKQWIMSDRAEKHKHRVSQIHFSEFSSVHTLSFVLFQHFSSCFSSHRAEKKERLRLKTVRVTRSQDRSVSNNLKNWFSLYKRHLPVLQTNIGLRWAHEWHLQLLIIDSERVSVLLWTYWDAVKPGALTLTVLFGESVFSPVILIIYNCAVNEVRAETALPHSDVNSFYFFSKLS